MKPDHRTNEGRMQYRGGMLQQNPGASGERVSKTGSDEVPFQEGRESTVCIDTVQWRRASLRVIQQHLYGGGSHKTQSSVVMWGNTSHVIILVTCHYLRLFEGFAGSMPQRRVGGCPNSPFYKPFGKSILSIFASPRNSTDRQ